MGPALASCRSCSWRRAHQREPPECVAGCRVRQEFHKRRAIFVNWKRYRVQGQTVETDDSHRLILITALRHPYRALEHAQVLVPDCGVIMEKVKKWRRSADPFSLSRPTVLAHAFRLQQMFECATMGGDLVTEGADASGAPRFFWEAMACLRADAFDALRPSVCARCRKHEGHDNGSIIRCSWCLLCWHPACVKAFARCTVGTGRVAAVKQATKERMERSGHVFLSLLCEQTHCLCELCRVCSAPTLC